MTGEDVIARKLQEFSRQLQESLDPDEFRQFIQEMVSSENNAASSKTPRSIGTRLNPKRPALAEERTCPCMCSWMNPNLWGTLPNELVQLVFARLPLPKTIQLKTLSTEWEERFTSEDPQFMQAFSEARPSIFAMVSEGYDNELMSVRLFDTKSDSWFSFMEPMLDVLCATMCAGDGGLVCIVPAEINKKEDLLVIIVLNPLRRQWRKLTPHALSKVQPKMVQLEMDDDTMCYKVIIVGEKKQLGGRGARMFADVHSSETEAWTAAKAYPDLIFGYQYRWDRVDEDDDWPGVLEETVLGPCAYDCERCQLVKFDDLQVNPTYTFRGAGFESSALVKDHLFLLHQELFESAESDIVDGWVYRRHLYVVSEYQYPGGDCESKWVKLKDHKCGEQFEHPPRSARYYTKLYACPGFLLLRASNGAGIGYGHVLAWLYNLSTTKWQKVPPVPDSVGGEDAMFELRWDTVP